jgi:hypothetical protein
VAARNEGIGLARWLVSALGTETIHGFRWNDPMPLVHGVAQAARGRFHPNEIGGVTGSVKG